MKLSVNHDLSAKIQKLLSSSGGKIAIGIPRRISTILHSYPSDTSSPQIASIRKILARHESPTMYGDACLNFDSDFDEKLGEAYVQWEEDKASIQRRLDEKNKTLRFYTGAKSRVKRNPIESFQAIFTTEIIQTLTDEQLKVYAFLFYSKAKESQKKAKTFYLVLLNRLFPVLQGRNLSIEPKDIQKYYAELSDDVRRQASIAMGF